MDSAVWVCVVIRNYVCLCQVMANDVYMEKCQLTFHVVYLNTELRESLLYPVSVLLVDLKSWGSGFCMDLEISRLLPPSSFLVFCQVYRVYAGCSK